MTEETLRALYRQGEEPVVAAFLELAARLSVLEQTTRSLEQTVQSLKEQLAKDSTNSSKPPSSDGLRKETLQPLPQSLRKKTGRKPGAQPGHIGKTLQLVDTPDAVILCRPAHCCVCQSDLPATGDVRFTRRQVVEMPKPRAVVTEYRAVIVRCDCCGAASAGDFPESVTQPVQYGANLLGTAAYLHSVHLLPYARCAQIMQDFTGVSFSPGSLSRALSLASSRLDDFQDRLKTAVASAPVLHADETGSRVAGKLGWFHVRCTPTLSYLFRHKRRGGEAVADLLSYNGRLVSDFYSNYVTLACAHTNAPRFVEHQFCGAHLLRELTFVSSVLGEQWAASLSSVIEDMVAACHRARERGTAKVWNAPVLARRFDEIVQKGLQAHPLPPVPPGKTRVARGKVRCLLDRLVSYRDEYLAFLFDLRLPFTNNEAERDVRMLKVKGKVSGCFRTEAGADVFCRLRSYVQTCRKHGRDLLACLRSVFAGQIEMPCFEHA